MKIHEKAALYDMLLKDYEDLIKELEVYKKDLEETPNREDLLKLKEENLAMYYAATHGSFSGMVFGLNLKLHKFKGMLDWYKSKSK